MTAPLSEPTWNTEIPVFSPLDEEAGGTLEDVVHALEFQDGFGVYFLCVRQAEQREQILTELRERLPEQAVQTIFVRAPENYLLRHIQATIPALPAKPDKPLPILCVYGMENWLGGIEAVQNSSFVGNLNATRNAFPNALGCPLVFIVPEHILIGIMRGAPDFFSIRSGVYFLDVAPENRILPLAEAMQSPELREAKGLGIEGRRKARAEWEEILNGYRALPVEKRDPQAEARALENLAVLHVADGNYSLALPLFEHALTVCEMSLGANHPETATSLNNLAMIGELLGDSARALPMYERALVIREMSLGDNHPDTATSLNNLAVLYEKMGESARALPLFERALVINEMSLGANHPDTARSLNNLAFLYEKVGDFPRALPLFERVLAIREISLGANHPDTATSLNNLAFLYKNRGDFARALPLYERALVITESSLGANHPETARILNNLAVLYKSMGDFVRALPLYERALAICKTSLGPNHHHTARSLNNLATLYDSMGNSTRALPLYEHALAINELSLGANHPHTCTVQKNITELRKRLKQQARTSVSLAPPKWEGSLFDGRGLREGRKTKKRGR